VSPEFQAALPELGIVSLEFPILGIVAVDIDKSIASGSQKYANTTITIKTSEINRLTLMRSRVVSLARAINCAVAMIRVNLFLIMCDK